MLILMRGAGDIASGIALRLFRSGFSVVMTDLSQPTSIRRTVCFSEAILHGEAVVEDVTARFAKSPKWVRAITEGGSVAVLADERGDSIHALQPDVVVDAILAKRNIGTRLDDAPVVIGVGPGFTAGTDCHAVVETMRGHTLGRVYYTGSALPNTGIPGNVGGYTLERVLRAPCDGVFTGAHSIGDVVQPGDICGYVNGEPMRTTIAGILRGLLPDGLPVTAGMKSGDVDPRCERMHCYTASDKALAVGGGVLEAILHLSHAVHR